MNSPFKIYGCSEAIDFNITNEEISINSLVENYQNRDYKSLVNNAQQYVEKNNSSAMAWNLLALGYRYTNNVEAALKIYEDLLRLNPGNFLLSTNLGNLYMAIGKISKAIDCFEVAFKKEPNHVSNLEALAIAYQDTGRNKEAIDCFKKVLALDEGKESARYHLARMLVRLNYYSEAIEHFDKTNYGLSKSHLLECLYYLGDKDKFYEHYRELINRKIINPLMASIGSHASIRFNISNKENPFCSDPFNYIKKQNITDNNELNDDLISSILEFHKSGESDPKSQPLLSNGKQSSGNIFLNQRNDIQLLKKILENKVKNYLKEFSTSNEGFIINWPKNFKIYGWLVSISSGGKLSAHIHKEGWLSGSLYFKMPSKKTKNEGNIVFSLDGANYPTDGKKFDKKSVDVNKGDLVLFPSSLFHHTIPFKSNEERVTFAFDIIPQN
jgi:tetratricopeptide (TPR) repeat protein|tara:strand:+ start:455 stop:1777 length:1323 start_codon:yes stop_codon:yes gene_type:complete